MPKPPDTGLDLITAVIADLVAIKRLPPKDRIQALAPLLSRGDATNIETRLATARSHAARDAVAATGNMSALARELGVTPQRISDLISAPINRKAAANRRAATKTGAAGQ